MDESRKITASHLRRVALIYIRQSTLRQVLENTESTERQYALRQRAQAFGWSADHIRVIDQDLGQSGASAVDRAGFQELVAEVSLGHVGLVVGLEVSRLARNSADWHQLLELCALTDTLIYDEDGLYDPQQFNDRLVLGLKGTMSEAELHVLKSRLQGGIRSKARRGELKAPLPVGLVYTPDDRVGLDPDQAVQAAIRLVFETFDRTGSAWKTVRYFTLQALRFPRRVRDGPHRGEVVWGPLLHSRVRQILHNPRYAGAFSFGRTHTRYTGDHKAHIDWLPTAEWLALIPDAHPGYITWEQFQRNQERLRANARAYDPEDGVRPPREGPALLQGMVLCGRCGGRMTVRYHRRQGTLIPDYMCQRQGIQRGEAICQQIPGAPIDAAIGALAVELLSPEVLHQALAVQDEYVHHLTQVDQLRRQAIERARYEAELAHRRYLQVDPDYRLVASTLEREWNAKLQALQDLEQAYDRQTHENPALTAAEQAAVAALATDIPRLWNDPATPARERKRLVRLIIADVTLRRDAGSLQVGVRLHSGFTRTLALPRPQPLAEQRRTSAAIVARIDALLNEYTERGVAQRLNAEGLHPVDGAGFTLGSVRYLRQAHGLRSRWQRLRDQGWLTQTEVAVALQVGVATVKHWRRQDLLRAAPYNEKPEYLYAPLTYPIPAKGQPKVAWRAAHPKACNEEE